MSLVEDIRELVTPELTARGCSLYDVEVAGTGRGAVVRVLVDRPGGIDLDTVARLSEVLSRALDHDPGATALRGPYSLEVSSPGLERPLRRSEHFRGASGELVSVKVKEDDGPARRLRGVLGAVDDTTCELTLDDGEVRRIALADVVQARTLFEWGSGARGKTKEVAPR